MSLSGNTVLSTDSRPAQLPKMPSVAATSKVLMKYGKNILSRLSDQIKRTMDLG